VGVDGLSICTGQWFQPFTPMFIGAILRKQIPTGSGQTLERVPNLAIALNPTTEVVGYVIDSASILGQPENTDQRQMIAYQISSYSSKASVQISFLLMVIAFFIMALSVN
jgi:hypothetical protein